MANEKDTIRQMTPTFDYMLISEPTSLNTRPSLFVYPLLTKQDVMFKFHEFHICESRNAKLTKSLSQHPRYCSHLGTHSLEYQSQ